MGVCKVTDKILCEFPWARRIPGNDHRVRCLVDGKEIKLSMKGSIALKDHEKRPVHTAPQRQKATNKELSKQCLVQQQLHKVQEMRHFFMF